MWYTTTSIALLSIASLTSAHMQMSKPSPYSPTPFVEATDDLHFPLDKTGSNYPCHVSAAKQYDNPPATDMPLGSTQTLAFLGTAVHGGGSCQVSITYDNPPTRNSVFKVIHSIEGGCPAKAAAGNLPGDSAALPDPDTYDFTIPTNLPTGKATIAWTWFNKIGNREMYMNCGPINLSGGAAKRSDDEIEARNVTMLMERDQNAFNALPNMFTANIMGIGNDQCATTEGTDLVFPNPGSSVDKPGSGKNFGPPSGTCVGGAGSGAPPPAAASSPAAAASSAPPAPGVFATVPASAPAPAATSAAVAPPPAASTTPAAVPPVASTPLVSSGSTAAGSACSPEGLWNCIGGTSFQQCGSGRWSVVQQLAAGTKCTPGQSATLNMVSKRAVRFSPEHVRRHVHNSV